MTDKQYLKTMGERIRVLMNERGLSIRKMSALCGVNESGLWQIMDGQKNSKVLTLKKIAKALEVDIAILL